MQTNSLDIYVNMSLRHKIISIYHQLITRTTPNKMIKPNFYGKSIAFLIISLIFLAYGILCICLDSNIIIFNINYKSPNLDTYEVGIVKKNNELINYNNTISEPSVYQNTVVTTTEIFELTKPVKQMNVYISIEGFSQNSFTYLKQSPVSQIKTGESSEKFDPFYKNERGQLIFPAGIMAHTYLQDSFELNGPNGIVEVNTEDIFPKDPVYLTDKAREKLIKSNVVPPTTWEGKIDSDGLADISDPRFQAWINPYTLNKFSKLYGRYMNLEKGIYTLKIQSTFPYGRNRKIILKENKNLQNTLRGKGKGIIIIGIAVCNIFAAIFYWKLSH